MYMSDNSILWPNGIKVDSDGYAVFYQLGTNKVEVPSEDKWPEGVKLKSPFVYDENGELVGFVDTKAMIVNGTTTITLPYKEIKAKFTSIVEGDLIVNAPNATVKEFTWAVASGEGGSDNDEVIITLKYKGCKTVDDVKAVDANYKTTDIVDGVWSEGLGDLEDGSYMFIYHPTLTTFTSDLSSLTNGDSMFQYCGSFTTFNANLSSLTNGSSMFGDTCLSSFDSDLSALSDGGSMFASYMSGTHLIKFRSNLSSLTYGGSMFYNCKLDSASVKNIIDTINTTYSSSLSLGMGCNNTTSDKDLFAQEIGYNSMDELLAALQGKGWAVEAQYNGRPTTTYSMRQPAIEQGEILPVFVKLEEVEEHASHASLDETKKYRMTWFHETTGSTEGYTQYTTLEEAIEALNIKPIERH